MTTMRNSTDAGEVWKMCLDQRNGSMILIREDESFSEIIN